MDTEPSMYDIRCSNACTRAGLAALVFSAIALLMLQPLQKTRELDALVRYGSSRLALKNAVDRLEEDSAWKYLKHSKPWQKASKDWTLEQFLAYTGPLEPSGFRRPEPKDSVTPSRTQPVPQSSHVLKAPAPVIELHLERSIMPIWAMAQALQELGDGDVLTLARTYSGEANQSIDAWADLRDRLINENRYIGPIIKISETKPPHFVPSYTREDLVKYLTLPQAIELATYQPPSILDLERLVKEQTNVILPSVGVSTRLWLATTFILIGILLPQFYFWLYYREARLSAQFPAPTTLFGVFARTKLTQWIFTCLVAVPPIAAGLLAYWSYWLSLGNAFIAALVTALGVTIREGERGTRKEPQEANE